MNILFFYNHTHSLDPIIYRYLKKHAQVYIVSKEKGDLIIDANDRINKNKLENFINTNNITHFLYVENSSYIPLFLNLFPKNVIKVMLLIDTHINKKRRLPYLSLFDLILLVNKYQVKEMKKYNPNTVWLTYGGDIETFKKIPKSKKKYSVTFNGNIIPWVHYHRFFMLCYLKIKGIPIFYSTAPYKFHNSLFNESKIVLNRSPLGGWNLRVFETLSSGSFLLTDRQKNSLDEIFKDKQHLVYYNSLADLKYKIDYYLTHEKEREQIARKGYLYARKYYSWEAQIKKMITILETFTYKSFYRKPYFLCLSDLECFSFRNNSLAFICLKNSLNQKEITIIRYCYLYFKYNMYLISTSFIINIVNIIRHSILEGMFIKRP